ncbi:hypothetical protein NDU88_004637 [Pleurodeles waltl]|uniref:Uncharacterized protein n=1 Tax=Pleurodeles waltl TaxID=8319 RepID=A0AAV7TS23_PLEWA|nr:hypothetical protein NDU88_004637 [Pleurodeles waltl]
MRPLRDRERVPDCHRGSTQITSYQAIVRVVHTNGQHRVATPSGRVELARLGVWCLAKAGTTPQPFQGQTWILVLVEHTVQFPVVGSVFYRCTAPSPYLRATTSGSATNAVRLKPRQTATSNTVPGRQCDRSVRSAICSRIKERTDTVVQFAMSAVASQGDSRPAIRR